jgi:hypothetical protein
MPEIFKIVFSVIFFRIYSFKSIYQVGWLKSVIFSPPAGGSPTISLTYCCLWLHRLFRSEDCELEMAQTILTSKITDFSQPLQTPKPH